MQITTYASSLPTYKFLNYSGVGGPGSYTMNYSIMCSYAVCATEFDAVSNQRIKTNIQNLESSIDIITQLRPVTFNYKNKKNMEQVFDMV